METDGSHERQIIVDGKRDWDRGRSSVRNLLGVKERENEEGDGQEKKRRSNFGF